MRLSLTALLLLAASFVLSAQDSKLYVVTHIDVTPNYIADGTKLLQQYTAESRNDKGMLRFEMLVDVAREESFHESFPSGRIRRRSTRIWKPITPSKCVKSCSRCWEARSTSG